MAREERRRSQGSTAWPLMPAVQLVLRVQLGDTRPVPIDRDPDALGEEQPDVSKAPLPRFEVPKSIEINIDRTIAGAFSTGDSSTTEGTVTVHEVHAEHAYFITGSAPTVHQSGTLPIVPKYPDDRTRALSEQLEDARARKLRIGEVGGSTLEIDKEILELRRRIREGGQLRAGDSLDEGRYLLIEQLGHGGFSVVWKARDRSRDEYVAVKVLHPNLSGDSTRLERFFRGARAMYELQHSAIVRILDPRGEDGGFFYFVMELLPGGDLRQAVLAGRVDKDRILDIVLQISEAVSCAHAQGMVHRDIKPANILLDGAGKARLTDFDLVGSKNTTGGTKTGALGTFIYAAPELLDRPQEADSRADVYGLGMTALFGLHGAELPMLAFQNTGSFVKSLACTAELKIVLLRAVNWNVVARFADAGALGEAIRATTYQARKSRRFPGRLGQRAVIFGIVGVLISATGILVIKKYPVQHVEPSASIALIPTEAGAITSQSSGGSTPQPALSANPDTSPLATINSAPSSPVPALASATVTSSAFKRSAPVFTEKPEVSTIDSAPSLKNTPAKVRVEAKGDPCNVTVNGASLGWTPVEATVRPGTVRISCKQGSSPTMSQSIQVPAGQTVQVTFATTSLEY